MQASATASSLDRQGIHTLFTTAASVGLGLALSVLVARTLGPGGKGVLDVASASAALFTLALGGSLNAGLTHLVARHAALPRGLLPQLAAWAAGAAILTGGVLSLGPARAARFGLLPDGDAGFWILFVVTSVGFGVWAASARGALIGRGGLITANRIDVVLKALLLVAYAGLALVPSLRAARYFAVAGVLAALGLVAALLVALRGAPTSPAGFWPSLLATTAPVHATNLLHFLNQRADVFFVQAFQGATEVGLYALAVSLAQTVLLVSSALAQPLLPEISAAATSEAATHAATRMCRRFMALGLLSAAALAVAASWLVPFVFGRDFSGSLPSLLVLLPGMLGFGLTNLLISYFVGIGRSATNLWISALTLLVTLAGNLWLTRRYGAVGAALTSTLAYVIAGFVSALCFARRSGASFRAIILPNLADWREAFTLLARFRP